MTNSLWIPVGWRKPSTTRTVWTYDGDRAHLAYYSDATDQWRQVDDDSIDNQESITHWSELAWPDLPPKEARP